ncbi:MAG: efflux RND transporter periplasmic adaptor subunit [Piscinibacter sp.]|uniref:efflux RND transporter periplasmic adaptor subunit n=1 Tax=Piscinibacter sp. TaxID=1903157 RepID=UPI002585F962|nr:efflux RND transporter periplasmic adaptor subunit [Piscinibacter sp.]MCW5664972.1 efflux RND transporter periplasmic adaptor subunit [Piscinibacter sp.]
MRPLLLTPLLLLASLAVPAQAAPAGPAVPTVAVGSASAGSLLDLDAVLQPVRQATLTAQVGGSVTRLGVQAGDKVKRGQALLQLDDREARAGLLRGDAGVAQAEAELANARTTLARQRDLLKNGFISQAAVDTAETQWRAAQAGLQQAQAARTQAALSQGFAQPAAPFDAVVLATHVETGDLALPGRALVTVYEPGRLRAVVQVPASRAALAAGATQVQVLLPDGRSLAPVDTELLPAADPVSQTVEWRLELPAGATGARPGQTVRVQARGAAPATPGTRATLPAAALLRRGELTAVYVAQAQGFVLRAVRVGPALGGQVEVLAGVATGERVALDPVRAGLAGAVPAAH